MKRTEAIVDLGDLAVYAEQAFNIPYNAAIDLFVTDHIVPMYETKSIEMYATVARDYGWSEDIDKIIKGYLADNDLKSFEFIG